MADIHITEGILNWFLFLLSFEVMPFHSLCVYVLWVDLNISYNWCKNLPWIRTKIFDSKSLLKSESAHRTDFCILTGTLPSCFFVCLFLRFVMSQRNCITSFCSLLTTAATPFPGGEDQHTRHGSFLLPAGLTSSVFVLCPLVCSFCALVWMQWNLESASFSQQ